jgi:hypothetical protein
MSGAAAKLIWLSRIVSICYLFFLLAGIMANIVLVSGYPGIILPALLPVLLLVFVLFRFWEQPLVSGICFILPGMILSLFTIQADFLGWLLLAAPPMFSGFIFIICWNLERQYTFFDH